jgi:hypothetical protein
MLTKPHRYASPFRRVEARRGKPADFIGSFDSVQPGDRVDLWVAVSGSERKRNLPDQEAWLRLKLQECGASVGRITEYVGPRYANNLPSKLRAAARQSKSKGRKLVAESVDRFIRHPNFYSVEHPNFHIWETSDLEDLRDHTLGAALVTWLNPSTTPKEVRAHERRRGQWAKSNKGGRPRKMYRPRATKADLTEVKRLRARGWSYGRIATKFDRSRATIQSWVKRLKGAV